MAALTPPQNAAQSMPAPAESPVPAVSPAASTSTGLSADLNEDKQLLEEVGSRSPAMRASYEKELRHVNEYIRDASSRRRLIPKTRRRNNI